MSESEEQFPGVIGLDDARAEELLGSPRKCTKQARSDAASVASVGSLASSVGSSKGGRGAELSKRSSAFTRLHKALEVYPEIYKNIQDKHQQLTSSRSGCPKEKYQGLVAAHYSGVTAAVEKFLVAKEKELEGSEEVLAFTNKAKLLRKMCKTLDDAHARCVDTVI